MPIPSEEPDYVPLPKPSRVSRARQAAAKDISHAANSNSVRFWVACLLAFIAMAIATSRDIYQLVALTFLWISGSALGALSMRVR